MPEKSNGRPQLWQDYRKGTDIEALILSFKNQLKYTMIKDKYTATNWDRFYSIAKVVMDRLVEGWIKTQQTYYAKDVKRVYYLSLEFLIGRLLGSNLLNLMMYKETQEAMESLNLNINDLRNFEVDAGLGNGGLGRLAACFLDSIATLGLPGYGYGIRYDFGIFKQIIRDGCQVEIPDEWLKFGNPWEIARPDFAFDVHFYGKAEHKPGRKNEIKPPWTGYQTVLGVPYDTPIPGYNNNTVNTLRLWSAKASEEFDLSIFNYGDYISAVENKTLSEVISKVLYPNDNLLEGKELRLKQEYFFVSCSLQDIIRRYSKFHDNFEDLPNKAAIQLNDTHPALGIAEMMHILVDNNNLPWKKAWEITEKTFSYTNHTLLPEALEKWPVSLIQNLLPRHMQIIYEINKRFLKKASIKFFNNREKISNISLIEEGDERQVRMANLAVVGSHSVNGVAELHTKLLTKSVLKDFYAFCPEKFNNKTNGITQRRWLLLANPGLSELITDKIGSGWITNLSELKKLEKFSQDKDFQKDFMNIKMDNKKTLSKMILDETGISVNPEAIFDIQIKRMHEYKRQLLNVLHIIKLYLQMRKNPKLDITPRVFIFGGKSAPGYHMAKLIIKFITSVAEVVNNDPIISDKLKVVFYPNYRVSVAEKLFPAADISEQISTAGMEASGTGNMKFTLNGALTIGTLDGANVEIRKEVGNENFFLFGNTVEDLDKLKQKGYNPWDYYHKNEEIKEIIDIINSDFFSPDNTELFKPIYDTLMTWGDRYFLLADFASYSETHMEIDKTYRKKDKWAKMAIINVANSGKFSSDRTISDYAREIWKVKPVPIELTEEKE